MKPDMCVYIAVYVLQLLFLAGGYSGSRESPFRLMAAGLIRLMERAGKRTQERHPLYETLRMLAPAENREEAWSVHRKAKYSVFFLVLFLCNTAALLVGSIQAGAERGKEAGRIIRGEPGESAVQQELLVTVPGILEQEPFTVQVAGREYTEAEAGEYLEAAAAELETWVYGENTSLKDVRSDLRLTERISTYPVTAVWSLSSYTYMDRSGRITGDIPEEGVHIQLRAELICQELRKEVYLEATLHPAEYSEKEQILASIAAYVEKQQEEQRTEEAFVLPEEIDDYNVQWEEKENRTTLYIFLTGLLIALLLMKTRDEKIQKQSLERKRQMIIDYPDITGRMMLFLEAGMPVKKAWEEIVKGYQKKRSRGIRYAYEEMMITYYEMQGGISEVKAYERFGKRCRVQQYRKFSSLLVQNLRKGAKGLAEVFQAESTMALEERKMLAKKTGEEAATKLLVPMFLMLLVVLVIVMIPAFISIEV